MIKRLLILLGGVFLLQFLLLISLYLYILYLVPTGKELKGCMVTQMYKVSLCPQGKDYVHLSGISPFMKRAVILSEDSSFFQHHGFDWKELQNSFEKNLNKGKYVRGGSTITQQLAKNLYLTKEKTLWRKFLEALITMRLEKNLSKNEILERYLNVVQFGPGIFGIKKASAHYFKKNPKDLELLESLYLTFLLPSPDKYSKSFNKGYLTRFGKSRLRHLVNLMWQTQRIDEGTYKKALVDLEYFPKEPVYVEESDLMDESAEDSTSDDSIDELSEKLSENHSENLESIADPIEDSELSVDKIKSPASEIKSRTEVDESRK